MEEIKEVNSIFESSEDGSKFIIKFDELFEKEKFKVYNQFDLSAKRNFKMINDLIKETYENIFLDENGQLKEHMQVCMLRLLHVQSKIMRAETLSVDSFLKLITTVTETADGLLLTEISKFVDDGYQLTLDEDTKKMKEKNKAVNDQLIISDDYAKTLIKIAYLDRLIIPLISQFFIYNKAEFPTKVSVIQEDEEDDGEELLFSEINQTIFNHLFKLIAKENAENIQNKLYKMVYARIIKTAFSAKRFWSVAETLGISKESSALEIYSKLLSNSVPKIILSKELNVVNFFSTIINNQIMFFNDVIARDVTQHIDEYMDVFVSKEEVAQALQFIHMNPIQERVVSMLTFKYFKSTDAVKRLSAFEYSKILLCCVKYLEKQKFVLLPKILLSNCIKQRDRTAITGVKIKSKIEESKRYKELMESKYKDFKYDVERNIQAMISTIYSSSFIDEKGNDVFESTAKIGNVAEEIVDLCYLV